MVRPRSEEACGKMLRAAAEIVVEDGVNAVTIDLMAAATRNPELDALHRRSIEERIGLMQTIFEPNDAANSSTTSTTPTRSTFSKDPSWFGPSSPREGRGPRHRTDGGPHDRCAAGLTVDSPPDSRLAMRLWLLPNP